MEQWMLQNGFGYITSRFLGYVLMIALGLVLSIIIHRKWTTSLKRLKWLVLMLLVPVPFSIYFVFDPIYQGDIYKESRVLSFENETTQSLDNGLLVIGIPGCKYCQEAPKDLHLLKRRNPDLKILFGVVGVNDNSVLDPYKELAQGKFDVINLNETNIHKELGIVQFPTFILIQNGEATRAWSSSNFGALAKAEFESIISR